MGGRRHNVFYNRGMHHYYQYLRCVAMFACLGAVCSADWAPAQVRTPFQKERNKLVDDEIVAAGIKNPRVIQALRDTLRHEFVPVYQRRLAYYDMALPIGEAQTISPPFIVAYMTEALDPQPTDKVLEIGTGSGYQAAVLSPLVRDVYTIEIVPQLARRAAKTLARLHYDNVHAKQGDGYQGWPEHAPFDKIIVTCSPEKVPPALVEQLREGGRMVIPVGERYQQTLYLMKKVDGKLVAEKLQPTLFVPMTGAAEASREVKPDPAHPTLGNNSFEKGAGEPPTPSGWHYQRQMQWVESPMAPDGKHYVTFSNTEPGRESLALQGFAVDGRQVHRLELSARIRGKDLRPGQNVHQQPEISILFYDENRANIGEAGMGPWRGTFDWRPESKVLDVPPRAREAIIRLGLFGATGELSVDAVDVKALAR